MLEPSPTPTSILRKIAKRQDETFAHAAQRPSGSAAPRHVEVTRFSNAASPSPTPASELLPRNLRLARHAGHHAVPAGLGRGGPAPGRSGTLRCARRGGA